MYGYYVYDAGANMNTYKVEDYFAGDVLYKGLTSNTSTYWLTTNSAYGKDYIFYIDSSDGSIYGDKSYNSDYRGLRPVICLKEDVLGSYVGGDNYKWELIDE